MYHSTMVDLSTSINIVSTDIWTWLKVNTVKTSLKSDYDDAPQKYLIY